MNEIISWLGAKLAGSELSFSVHSWDDAHDVVLVEGHGSRAAWKISKCISPLLAGVFCREILPRSLELRFGFRIAEAK